MPYSKRPISRKAGEHFSIELIPFFLFFLWTLFVQGQTGNLTQRVWLLANTADIPEESDFYRDFREEVSNSAVPVHVIVSGDLINDCLDGQPPRAPVERLLKTVEGLDDVQMTLLPGDRDWDDSGKQGLDCINELDDLIDSYDLENVGWPFNDGCPGPEKIDINDDLLLIAVNTQWWNHPYRKPRPVDAECDEIADYAVEEELRDAIEENKDRNIILAGHYPPFSLGEYGGRFPLSSHLLPPVIGSVRIAFHQHVGTPKDINNERFESFAHHLQTLGLEYGNLICVGGQDYNQQIIRYEDNYIINSGAPVSGKYAAKFRKALLSESTPGLMEINYYDDGEVRYQLRAFSQNGFSVTRQGVLFQSPCAKDTDEEVPVNEVHVPCMDLKPDPVQPELSYKKDSATAIAGAHYEAGPLKRFFLGNHYRDSWMTPVKVPMLKLDSTAGGLHVFKRGGGRQTQSLKFIGKDGYDYAFRSVDKDPSGTFSYRLRNTIIADVTRDQTSSQHPYGAIAVAPLLSELGILHATPRLFMMPDDPRLGPYREEFAGMLGMLEERPDDQEEGQRTFADADQIRKSYELFQELYDHHNVRVDAQEFARARVFDMLIGDWSKHEDNWKWAGFRQGDETVFRPVPRDRDHAFSKLDGLLPWLASREWAVPNLEHFSYKLRDVRSLTFQARHMDRFLTSELTRRDWKDAARFVQEHISPEDIQNALRKMPPEIYQKSGGELAGKLLARLSELEEYADRYYEILARYVDVVGSNDKERFEVTRHADGTTTVTVTSEEENEENEVIYQRTFYPGETKEIRLYGLHGADDFYISGQSQKAIIVRIIGGPGRDDVIDESEVSGGAKRTFIYEKSERANIQTGSEAKRIDTWNEELYYYDRTSFTYNSYFPIAYLSFNTFNGLMFSAGVDFTNHNFAKKDFSARHGIQVDVSTIGNFSVSYEGRFRHVIHKWDLLGKAVYARPENFNFFFGLGNETVKDEELFNQDYYLVSYNSIRGDIGLIRDFWRRSTFTLLLGYERNKANREPNTILDEEADFFGLGEIDFFRLNGILEIDFRDHKVFPSRGIRFFAHQEGGLIEEEEYGISDLFLEYFVSTRSYPLTLGLKAGYSTTFGTVPFYKLPRLGQDTGLRGFQRDRFTGDGRLYFNSELRVHLARVQTAVLPFRLGLRGFFDRGKIIEQEGDSDVWHNAYGGGFYIIPLSRSYSLSVLVGASEEESAVVSFQLGTNF